MYIVVYRINYKIQMCKKTRNEIPTRNIARGAYIIYPLADFNKSIVYKRNNNNGKIKLQNK